MEYIGEYRACWVAYRACGYVVMRIWSCVDMRLGDIRLWFCGVRPLGTKHLAVDLLFSHPMPRGMGD